jgi:DNA invertase Pin-like site-specific DNA recombinase
VSPCCNTAVVMPLNRELQGFTFSTCFGIQYHNFFLNADRKVSPMCRFYPVQLTGNLLATSAEFESDLIRLRTREGMKIARAKGRLRGKQPKLSDKQQKELSCMHGTGQYTISDLAELFSISRPTVYRTLLCSAQP